MIIAQIAPLIKQRREMRGWLKNFIEVKLDCCEETRSNRDNYVDSELVYQWSSPDLFVNTDVESKEACLDEILEYMKEGGYF